MKGLAGAVFLYNPNDEVLSRIRSYIPHIERLYIVDDSEKPGNFVPASPKMAYLSDRTNRGIAARLNQAASLALKEGFQWLLTMDQDSSFSEANISNYLRCADSYSGVKEVAMFGIEFQSAESVSQDCHGVEKTQIITSGSILNLKLFPLIGPFDEALFIDQVDFDYCYRAVLKGYSNIQFRNIFMEHSLGQQSTHRSLKTMEKTTRSLHNPVRLYYMTRNYLYMRKNYGSSFPLETAHSRKDVLNRIKNNLIYGSNKLAVIKYIIAGIVDYRRRKMGKK